MRAETAHTNETSPDASPAETASYKKKQTVVVVLLVVLLIAILTQPDKEDVQQSQPIQAKAVAHTEGTAPSAETDDDSAELVARRASQLTMVRELSRIGFNEITGLSLFAAEPKRQLTQFVNSHRVQAVYGNSDAHTALLGETIVRSGQPLPDGTQVLNVTTDGIQVAP